MTPVSSPTGRADASSPSGPDDIDSPASAGPAPETPVSEIPVSETTVSAGTGSAGTGPSRRDEGRRAALLDAADRVVQRDGPSAPVSAIVAEAGVTKPVLYRHFGDKSGLYRALAERHTEQLLVDLRRALLTRGSRRDRFVATIDTYLRAIESRPQVYRLLTASEQSQDDAVAAAVQTIVQRIAEELAAGILVELRMPPAQLTTARAWAYGIVGLVRGAGDWWLAAGGPPRQEITQNLADLLLGVLGECPPDGPQGAATTPITTVA